MKGIKGSTVKKPYEQVRDYFISCGYSLLTSKDDYKNTNQKLKTICPKNHEYIVSFYHFLGRNFRCPICSGNKAHTIESVREIFAKEGYELLSTEYVKNTKKLTVKCPVGHLWHTISLNNFVDKKVRCPQCSGNISGKHSKEFIKEQLEKHGYILLSDYENASSKINTLCPKGHAYDVTYSDFNTGHRCRECAGQTPYTLDTAKEVFAKEGYVLKDAVWNGYANNSNLVCPKGHECQISLAHFKSKGVRCPACSNDGTSKSEKEIFSFVKNFYNDAISNNWDVIPPQEIDIYVPSIKLAIEYCGLRWHSEQFKEDKNYHINKMKKCNELGIRLITIFEDEWLDRQEQVKGFLLSVLNKNENKYGARSLDLKEVSKKDAVQFLDKYHIQGSTKSLVRLGLYDKDELLGLITGNNHHRQGFSDILVLNRLVFKSNCTVSGGASKLNKALISWAKSNNYTKIISWSDNRWSEGRVYEKLGYQLVENLRPDYSYVNGSLRESKQSNKKKDLAKKNAIGSTEREMALSLGLYRIWDCGKKRWEIK